MLLIYGILRVGGCTLFKSSFKSYKQVPELQDSIFYTDNATISMRQSSVIDLEALVNISR